MASSQISEFLRNLRRTALRRDAAAIAGKFIKSIALAQLKTAAALTLAVWLVAGGLLLDRLAHAPQQNAGARYVAGAKKFLYSVQEAFFG